MPLCRYFTSPSGCARGNTCRYGHIRPEQPIDIPPRGLVGCHPVDNLYHQLQQFSIVNNGPSNPFPAPANAAPLPTDRIPCRFFVVGACKNGDQCRFLHDVEKEKTARSESNWRSTSTPETLQGQPSSRSKPGKATSVNTRDLGGAEVKFGEGAQVVSIEPALAETARLQMCNVTCSWYQPSKTATLEFSHTEAMNDAAYKLERARTLDRVLECRTAVDKSVKPWKCLVKVGNLDISTSVRAIKDACGVKKPHTVTFAANSYSLSSSEIGQAIRKLLSSRVTVEEWSQPDHQAGRQCKATATLQSMEQATKVISDFNGYKLPQLAGSGISLSHMVKAKFTTLTSIYEVVKAEIENTQADLRSATLLAIKVYPSKGPFTIIHIISSSPKEVGRAKTAINSILKGHTVRSGKDVVWHQFFLRREGVAYLNNLSKEHNVYIYRDAKKSLLSLYGPNEQRAMVESTLIQAVDDLSISKVTLELDTGMSTGTIQKAYRKMIAELGKSFVKINASTRPRIITIDGLSDKVDRAREILREVSTHPEAADGIDDESDTCAVCWCEVSEDAYTTPCGHTYDKECFASQCSTASAPDFPIRCLGAEGSCEKPISFSELELALTRDQLDSLLSSAFINYIRTHPAQYQHCPTASCDQVYSVTDDCKIFTCSTCLTSICTTCGAISHEGLTCEQNKNVGETDEAFVAWKKEAGAKDCPVCGSTIEKNGGCRHMQCAACRAHICWVCLKSFKGGDETYDHLAKNHGGIFD